MNGTDPLINLHASHMVTKAKKACQ